MSELKLAPGLIQCPDCELVYLKAGTITCQNCTYPTTMPGHGVGEWCPDCVKTKLAYNCMECEAPVMMSSVIKSPFMFRGAQTEDGLIDGLGRIPNPAHAPSQNVGVCETCCSALIDRANKRMKEERANA